MHNKTITLKVTLNVDDVWAKEQTKSEILDSIKNRMRYGLGFRGSITEFKVARSKV